MAFMRPEIVPGSYVSQRPNVSQTPLMASASVEYSHHSVESRYPGAERRPYHLSASGVIPRSSGERPSERRYCACESDDDDSEPRLSGPEPLETPPTSCRACNDPDCRGCW